MMEVLVMIMRQESKLTVCKLEDTVQKNNCLNLYSLSRDNILVKDHFSFFY